MERNPAPDPSAWRALRGEERLRRGLTELYEFYDRNQDMFGRLMADYETHELTRELFDVRFGEHMAGIRSVLAGALPRNKKTRAVLDLALNFSTWRQLSRSGLTSAAAADAMVQGLLAQRATVRR